MRERATVRPDVSPLVPSRPFNWFPAAAAVYTRVEHHQKHETPPFAGETETLFRRHTNHIGHLYTWLSEPEFGHLVDRGKYPARWLV